ncbi:MAG TPA: 3-keto-5-aminohexanoate cleavage protein [Steroidobacteraceae bacterium]|nr:3-keto-5-aminohexanoate cleavage protein [Steroidobacteraceae bacterium]
MARRRKVIITCAITGAAHTPCMSPHLPITPQQIAAQAIAAAEAGAAIIHLHARDPRDGFPSTDPAVYEQFLRPIKEGCDAIINITTGQPDREALINPDPKAMFERRLAAPMRFAPELCSFNMGPFNPGLWAYADRYEGQYRYDWEREFLLATKGITMINNYANMEYIARELGEQRGVRFEFECFDIGHLHTLRFIMDRGWVKPPLLVQSIFGFPGGLGADPKHVLHAKQTADDLFGDDYEWSCLAAGSSQMAIVTMAAILGGHVRVGLEDSLWLGPAQLARSNAAQVERIRRILEDLSIGVATPAEAREILQTKGSANTRI